MTLQGHPRSSIHILFESQCAINSNLSPISHRLATIHPWQTDRRTDRRRQPWQQLDRYYISSLEVEVEHRPSSKN